jgi:hypothetical protein
MSNEFDDPRFHDDPFGKALTELETQLGKELSDATADLRQAKDQIIGELKTVKDMVDLAGTDQRDLAQKSQAVKDDLAAFESRFGAAGEKIGRIIRSKVSGFLPV